MIALIITIAILCALSGSAGHLRPMIQRWKYNRTRKRPAYIFEHQYLENKAFYLYRFRRIPSITYIYEVDVTTAFAFVRDRYEHQIVSIHQICQYNREKEAAEFNKTVFVLKNELMIELANSYAAVLYSEKQFAWAEELIKAVSGYRLPEKQQPFEINIISAGAHGLELKQLPVTPTELNVDDHYNDDFKEVDAVIRARLGTDSDKGIILLHGLPGTGKTTYLRHLIGTLQKKVLFVSPAAAGNLMQPDFIDLLIDNPNSILVIEDAENIIMDRKYSGSSSVSNLLNISDGLLSDCLNVQIICTFNSALSTIDNALLRQGRLIARYEFGKLSVEKAQVLSDQFGFKTVITQPMTIAEIANQHEKPQPVEKNSPIGFRRQEVTMN